MLIPQGKLFEDIYLVNSMPFDFEKNSEQNINSGASINIKIHCHFSFDQCLGEGKIPREGLSTPCPLLPLVLLRLSGSPNCGHLRNMGRVIFYESLECF